MELLTHLSKSYKDALECLTSFVNESGNLAKTEAVAVALANAFNNGNKAIICGNGGSACDAMHFAEEFTGRYRGNRKALPVISLTDPSHITCVGNDFGFDEIFARGVEAFGKPGDLFFAISTSGNSENVIRAVKKAKELGVTTISLLGKTGGTLKGMCDYEFIVHETTSDRIQEVHMTLLHIIIEGVERQLFPENYK